MTQIEKESIDFIEDSAGISGILHRNTASVDKFYISFRIRTNPVRRRDGSKRDLSFWFWKSSAKAMVRLAYSTSSRNSTPTSVRVRQRMRALRLIP